MNLDDLLSSSEASEMLPPTYNGTTRRIEPYVRAGRIAPAMKAGTGKRAPLLFKRKDVERLRDEILQKFQRIIEATPV